MALKLFFCRNDAVVPVTISDSARGIMELELTGKSFNTVVYW